MAAYKGKNSKKDRALGRKAKKEAEVVRDYREGDNVKQVMTKHRMTYGEVQSLLRKAQVLRNL